MYPVPKLFNAEERAQQTAEGARLARQEGTLTLRQAQKKPSKVAPPKGHEAFLRALETSEAIIRIEKCDGTIVQGLIKHSDKFTISIRTVTSAGHVDRVIFKHDISEFSAISARPSVPQAEGQPE